MNRKREYLLLEVDSLLIATSGESYYGNQMFIGEYLPKGYVIKQILQAKPEYGSKNYIVVCKKWWEIWK